MYLHEFGEKWELLIASSSMQLCYQILYYVLFLWNGK